MNNNHNPIPAELLNRKAQTIALLAGAIPGPICGVYLIHHRTTGKAYVGQSVNVTKRWADHRKAVGDTRLARAIHKHGSAAFDWEILVTCARAELNDLEAYFVDQCGTLSPKGYNLLSGGGQGQEVTEEVRVKMSEAMRTSEARKAAMASPEYRATMSESLKNSEAHKAAMASQEVRATHREASREANRRLAQDPAWLAKNREAVTRLAQDPAWLAKNRARGDQRTHVLVHVTTGAVTSGLRWELTERLGINSGSLSDLIKGTRKTCQGFRLALPDELPLEETP